MTSSPTLDLSIVIVNWNALDDLRRCLASLRPQLREDTEVIVVDNGSRDGSSSAAREALPEVHLLALPRNLGFAAGCNRGIERSGGTWILTLNNDTVAAPDFLDRLRAAARGAAPDVGMLQPRVVLQGRDRLNSTGVLVHRDGSANDRDFDAPLDTRTHADDVLCATAGAGLYRREMLEELRLSSGYFDPAYFMYFEDVDLGWRCRLAGWKARYIPDAVVEHRFQGSSHRHGAHFVTIQCMRNRVRTLLKNASWRLLIRSLPRTASDLLWLLQHAGGRALSDWLGAVHNAAAQRAQVSRLLRISRRVLERRWMRTEPGTTRGETEKSSNPKALPDRVEALPRRAVSLRARTDAVGEQQR
jgi:GT2 family glycosyltransferase